MNSGPRRIDAHVHFWELARGDYDWMTPDLKEIYRDFGPEHLRSHLLSANIDEILIVQAAATVAETEFILSIAESTDFVSGVVGWFEMDSSTAPELLSRLSENSYLKGIRPMIQDIADSDWMLRTELTPSFQMMTQLDLSFDCLVKPGHLKNLFELLSRHPDLRAIINHCAKPEIADEHFSVWAEDISRLAEQTSAFCKFSGLVTEAGANWQTQQLKPYTDHVLQSFGPERLIFGSDWPVVNLAGGYQAWFDAANDLLSDLSVSERAKVFGENAALAYAV